jgi:hypothetical protein
MVTSALANITTANFVKKAVLSTWLETAPTVALVEQLVGNAIATGYLNPSNLFVVMPQSTYRLWRAGMLATFRDLNGILDYTVVPSNNAAITKTFITDGTGYGLGIGADIGLENEQMSVFSNESGNFGYSLHLIQNPTAQTIILGSRIIWGGAILNPNGILFAAVS